MEYKQSGYGCGPCGKGQDHHGHDGYHGHPGYKKKCICFEDQIRKDKDHFDYDYYRLHNPDVESVFGSDNASLWHHWGKYGYSECRVHRFVEYKTICMECCPNPCRIVVEFCDLEYPDPSCEPRKPKPCCPLPKLCTGQEYAYFDSQSHEYKTYQRY